MKKCIGCGFCCIKAICSIGVNFYEIAEKEMRCPGLLWSNQFNRYLCKLAIEYPHLKEELTIDTGCCCGLNTWRNDIKNRD